MKKYSFILLLSIFSSITLFGQVTFIVNSIPEYTPPDDIIYIAGSLNSWDPGNPEFALSKNDNNWFIILPEELDGTLVEFKFTRGDWGTVEKGATGEEIANRQFVYGNGDTVYVDILNWADNGGGGGSTAADNVSIMDDAFFMPQLDRTRRIWLYLPPDYDDSNENFPVLYMQDGQNLFDTYTSYSGEWEVDETLNNLFDDGYQVPIVIGIDNGGGERLNEYSPWVNLQYGGGEGDEYIDFIVNTLKPYVDSNYRTISNRESTGIMGSSMGGFISHYGVLKHQDIFSKAGIFSPSYWFSDTVWTFTTEMGKQNNMKLYQLIGGQEGVEAVADMWAMHDVLANLGFNEDELLSLEVPDGEHNETFWRNQFAAAYLWMFESFANEIDENHNVIDIEITPNPVIDEIILTEHKYVNYDTIEIIDMNGNLVMKINIRNTKKIDVRKLVPGSYILRIQSQDDLFQGKFIKQ
jgi:predicted alpha/beta superfamily hydrolase